MRKEVEELAQVFASADDDEALEEFKKLLEDFGERTVKKISDDDLPGFHEELKKLADEFFEFEEE
nr:unknown [Edwardsiella phage eiDWF]